MAASSSTCPFLLKLFYRTGAFHRPDEFSSDDSLPFVPVYTFESCTLHDLVLHLAAAQRPVLPSPSVGTRVAFRLVYIDSRGSSDKNGDGSGGPPRFVVKDLGSVVIGGGGRASVDRDSDRHMADADDSANDSDYDHRDHSDDDRDRTLSDSRYVVGDYISCAILPPLPDGRVAPASDARSGRGFGIGEGRASAMPRFVGRRDDHWGNRRGPRPSVPVSEWRRGEMLPDEPSWGRSGGGSNGGGGGGGGRGWRSQNRRGRW